MTTSESARSHVKSQSVRLVRRAGGARLPFLPYGLIPALGLALLVIFGLTAFARGAVEDAASRATREALDGAGATWATAKVSGQWVVLEGTPPTVTDGLKAVAAVYDAKASTLFGATPVVTRVTDNFNWTGQVGVESKADSDRPELEVVQSAAAATPPPATPAAVAKCEQTLAGLLGRSQIKFSTASAKIGPESISVLDAVARAAGACPGVLRIEGHTDTEGSAAFNSALSSKRAEAVRAALMDRGVPGARLTVTGYGATKPIASNDTPEGRDSNRRIEMRVAPPT